MCKYKINVVDMTILTRSNICFVHSKYSWYSIVRIQKDLSNL